MTSNDETVLAIPHIQCPSCMYTLDLSGPKVNKLSKEQRRKKNGDGTANSFGYSESSSVSPRDYRSDPTGEDSPSEYPENVFMLVSCNNERCNQYNKLKVLKLPKIETPSVKVTL